MVTVLEFVKTIMATSIPFKLSEGVGVEIKTDNDTGYRDKTGDLQFDNRLDAYKVSRNLYNIIFRFTGKVKVSSSIHFISILTTITSIFCQL